MQHIKDYQIGDISAHIFQDGDYIIPVSLRNEEGRAILAMDLEGGNALMTQINAMFTLFSEYAKPKQPKQTEQQVILERICFKRFARIYKKGDRSMGDCAELILFYLKDWKLRNESQSDQDFADNLIKFYKGF